MQLWTEQNSLTSRVAVAMACLIAFQPLFVVSNVVGTDAVLAHPNADQLAVTSSALNAPSNHPNGVSLLAYEAWYPMLADATDNELSFLLAEQSDYPIDLFSPGSGASGAGLVEVEAPVSILGLTSDTWPTMYTSNLMQRPMEPGHSSDSEAVSSAYIDTGSISSPSSHTVSSISTGTHALLRGRQHECVHCHQSFAGKYARSNLTRHIRERTCRAMSHLRPSLRCRSAGCKSTFSRSDNRKAHERTCRGSLFVERCFTG